MNTKSQSWEETPSKGPKRMQKWNRKTLLTGLAFQLVVLLAMIAMPLMTMMSGDTILLRVVPVDPRDLFRGDYVILSYDFSRIPPKEIPEFEASMRNGKTIFVSIEPDKVGKHWHASRFSLEKPSSGKFLCGRYKDWNRIEFGIESYFVQRGEGWKYESAARNQNLSAEIVLSRNGKSILKRLVINEPAAPVVVARQSSSVTSLYQFSSHVQNRFNLRQLTAEQFGKGSKDPGTIILDIRSPESYESMHIKGSINLPFESFSSEKLSEIIPDKATKVLLFSDHNIPEKSGTLFSNYSETRLKVPAFVQLDFYGYPNVWELATMVDSLNTYIEFEFLPNSSNTIKQASFGAR